MIRPLRRSYTGRHGVPVISHLDDEIFVYRYFAHCLSCSYCHDACCSHGCDVDVANVGRLQAAAGPIEAYVGVPSTEWFVDEVRNDPEFPGGATTRTRVRNGSCVFLNRRGRGCLIHSYCLEQGIDYHDLKPAVCAQFPVTWENGLLRPSDEFAAQDLACYDDGPTVYRGARDELGHYFSPELVAELDEIEIERCPIEPAVPPRRPPARRIGT